jgi:ABC-type antimicrobial peptide transport system permease subunit
LKEYLNNIYGLEQLVLLFVTVAAILAIVLGCMGLYGLMAFSAVQRTKEIGLRKVLGATVADILIIFSSEYIRLLGLSFVIATPVSWYLSNYWLDGFTYRIEIGIGVFLVTFIAVLIVAAGAVSWRLWKVIITNPVESLRNE